MKVEVKSKRLKKQIAEHLRPDDLEQGLLAMVGEPDLVRDCLDRFTGGAIELGCRLVAAGAEALMVASPLSGAGHLSRRLYREWVVPWEKECLGRLQAQTGVPVYTGVSGLFADRLDLLLETGTAGLAGAIVPPTGDLDLARELGFLAGRAFLMGGIDAPGFLLQGSRALVKQRLAELATLPRKGFVLAPCSPIPAGVPEENLDLLRARNCPVDE